MWQHLRGTAKLFIDRFHLKNHKSQFCQTQLCADRKEIKAEMEQVNTETCEQVRAQQVAVPVFRVFRTR